MRSDHIINYQNTAIRFHNASYTFNIQWLKHHYPDPAELAELIAPELMEWEDTDDHQSIARATSTT